jgi:hypothetical protein
LPSRLMEACFFSLSSKLELSATKFLGTS